jgi:hypothetical protein
MKIKKGMGGGAKFLIRVLHGGNVSKGFLAFIPTSKFGYHYI